MSLKRLFRLVFASFMHSNVVVIAFSSHTRNDAIP